MDFMEFMDFIEFVWIFFRSSDCLTNNSGVVPEGLSLQRVIFVMRTIMIKPPTVAGKSSEKTNGQKKSVQYVDFLQAIYN